MSVVVGSGVGETRRTVAPAAVVVSLLPKVARGRRLLLVATSLARGGAEREVVDLAIALGARGWTVAVVSMTAPNSFLEELATAGVEVASLKMRRGRPTPGGLLRYGSFIRRWRPDIVHSHMVHANLLARVGRVFAPRVPVVCTVHTVREGRRWRALAYRLTDPLASATTAVSSAAAERSVRIGAVPRGRIVVIPNGVDIARLRAATDAFDATRKELHPGDCFLWVTVGRLVAEKGHLMLLEAFEAVHGARPGARLAIAGGGPMRGALERCILDRRLASSAVLLGERLDVPAILASADGFVLSSQWEGLPIVLLEAAAQALPIVCTDVGGCREVAKPELGAVLTNVDPMEIAGAMVRIMDLSADQRAGIGRNLRTHVELEFDMQKLVLRWEALYSSVMGH
jgi:glycosyltransferase involved in cell wall biosynthesis